MKEGALLIIRKWLGTVSILALATASAGVEAAARPTMHPRETGKIAAVTNGKIAFIRNDSPEGSGGSKSCLGSDVWIMNNDGTGQENITNTNGTFAMGDPAWSPDGQTLAFLVVYQFDVEDDDELDGLFLSTYDLDTETLNWAFTGLPLPNNSSHDAAAFCQDPYGPAWSPNGKKVAIQSYYGTATINLAKNNKITYLDGSQTRYMNDIDWSPSGEKFAFGPLGGIETSDTRGGAVTPITWNAAVAPTHPAHCDSFQAGYCDLHILSRPKWSPDGETLLVRTGRSGFSFGGRIGFLDACFPNQPLRVVDPNPRGMPHGENDDFRVASEFYQPAWSPAGDKVVFSDRNFVEDPTEDGGGHFEEDVWVMNADGTEVEGLTNTSGDIFESSPAWQPVDPPDETGVGCTGPSDEGLEVTLKAFSPGGESPLEGVISIAQTVTVELTIANVSEETLDSFEFTGDGPLVIDERSTGGLEIVTVPDPPIDPDLSLDAGEEATFTFEVEATKDGIAAAHSQVTATDESTKEHVEAHSLRFDIADGIEMTRNVGQYLRMQAIDQLMQETFGQWHGAMAERGQELAAQLSEIFTPEERLQWFGSETGLPLTPTDFATALLRGTAAEMVAAVRPKSEFKGYTTEQLDREYDEALAETVGKGVAKYVDGYKHLAKGTKKFLTDSWSESLLGANYLFGTATAEERAQWEAFSITLVEGTVTSSENLSNTVFAEIPKWQENGTYLAEAWRETEKQTSLRAGLLKIKELVDKETAVRDEILKLADTDPALFQRKWAQRDGEILNMGLPLIFDTILGGGVVKGAGALKGVVVRGKGAAVLRTGEALGVVDEGGNVVKGSNTALELSDSAIPHGPSNGTVAELNRAADYLQDVEGATVVQSTDLGRVYELPNLGGVPETTLDAKAVILKSLEDDYFKKTGQTLKLAEVLKPSSALRKPGGVAKLELTAEKTGKPAMLDAGAPPDILAEASVWRGPKPDTLPGFKNLPKPRQQAALKEWKKANEAWAEFENPTDPTSKTARLKQCIGERKRVPLDLKPNETTGFQRFVTAEFEVVEVTEGAAKAKLIRVKYYEVEVFDTKTGKVLNRKTVVDVPEAAPQTPDADAVGMAKVVGTTSDGKPILEPLSRAEREFVMPRYIDKNIKARRLPAGSAGAVNDLAEHGATLIMDDASAKAAGKLLPMFGVPFLPEGVGTAYLAKIAPFVSAKNATPDAIAKMYHQMVQLVRSEGGFGQHAIVVTSDSRYLGDIPFANW